MSEQNQGQPAAKTKNVVAAIAGGAILLLVVVFLFLTLMGPIVGNVFSTINSSLSSFDGEYHSMDAGNAAPAPMRELAAVAPEEPRQAVTTDRLIIRNGQLTLTVKDTLAAQKEVESIVAKLAGEGAFVVSSNARASYEGASPYIDMTIRVPADQFDEAMDRIAGLAMNVEGRSENAQDVTAEYVDLQTRLESLEAARNRLLQIMKESATTEELLMAEQQLTQREAEIESIKGQMKYLSESARLSSVTVSLLPYRPDQPLDTRWRPAETARSAFDALVNSLRGFADFLIVFAIVILPWLLFFGGIWWGARKVIRKRRAGKSEEKPKE